MTAHNSGKLFGNQNVRSVWDDQQQKWYISIVDVVGVLTDQPDYRALGIIGRSSNTE